ncbi:MAG TPA: CpsD/CapB family tyrosine-protein kinase [Bacteroidota bacterium]|nr:CpsD/CapB family tyrosine-protein kinase [Bacteroidota bacterium]
MQSGVEFIQSDDGDEIGSVPLHRSDDDPTISQAERVPHSLVRLEKNVVFSHVTGKKIDGSTVNHQFYDHFKYSLLPKEHSHGKLTLGITSPNQGEGKTLVAANLAASLAMANQRETLLVDLNIRRPKLHEIFGTPLTPGLLESFHQSTITVAKTHIKHLHVLSAGNAAENALESVRMSSMKSSSSSKPSSTVGLEQLTEFRNVLLSLESKYELIIVDLPSINESAIPTLFTSQLGGVIVVVNAGRTKQRDLERLIATLNEGQVMGFVFNRVGKHNLS